MEILFYDFFFIIIVFMISLERRIEIRGPKTGSGHGHISLSVRQKMTFCAIKSGNKASAFEQKPFNTHHLV